jgi:glycosyltransferase involved in cell wall biosynthesis
MTPWLSILVPVYNVEPYIEDCLVSILAQNLEGVELVVVDDQSSDKSFSTLNDIKRSSGVDIKLLRHACNRGVAAARNTLVDAATGDYLWFVDPDDAMSQGAVDCLKQIIASHSPDLILCDYKRWRPEAVDQSAKENHLATFDGPPGVLLDDQELLFKGIYGKGRLHIWSKISKRILWAPELRFPVGRYFEDVALVSRLALRAQNFFYQDIVWIHYRQRTDSIIATPSLKKIEDMSISVCGVLDEWLKRYPNMNTVSRSAFIGYCIKIYSKAIKDLAKINHLTPEIIDFHRKCFYKNMKINKRLLIYYSVRDVNFVRIRKLLKIYRYL